VCRAQGSGLHEVIDLLVARNLDAMQYTIALGQVVVFGQSQSGPADAPSTAPRERPRSHRPHGADATPRFRLLPAEQIKMLIERRPTSTQEPASAVRRYGLTALDLARLHGDTPWSTCY